MATRTVASRDGIAYVLICILAALTSSGPALAKCRGVCGPATGVGLNRNAGPPSTVTRSGKNANVMKKKSDTTQSSTSNAR
jgi:hypothetical protein